MAHKFMIALIIGMAEVAFAGNSVPQLIPFQGRLTDTGGVPINTPVTVKYRIYPPTGSCYLYEDTQSVSPNAFGIFSVLIGATGHSTGPANNFANIFNNSSPGISDSCAGVYVPVANDWRRIEVLVDGVPFSDMQTVGAAPFSFNTNMLEGKRAADFIAKDTTVTQAALTSLLNGSDASSLHNHDSLYAKIDGSNSYTGNISTTGSVGVGTNSATADVDIQKNSPRLRLGAATGAGGTSSVEFYSGTTTQRARIESNENANGLKFYTGSTEAMSIDANKNVYVGGSLKVTGTVGVGAYTAAQDATLVGQLASLGTSATGSMWIQSTSGQLRYWDGAVAKTLLPQGSVIETSSAFGGDVSGTFTNLTVNKIKGRVVDDTGLTANKILKYDGAKWIVADDGVGWTASDASYSAKGIVQFDTNATTSGMNVVGGVASVNTGTTANKIVKLDSAAKLPGVDGSQLTNILATDLVSLVGTGIVQKNGAGSYSTVSVNSPLTYTAGALGLVDSGVTAGTYSKVTVDTKGRVTVGANIGASDVTGALGYTPLNKAGDVMTGSIGLGNYTNATEATLISGYGAGDKGKTWFNSTTGQVKYWDGTAAKALGISGAGLTSLGGQTGSTQTFAIGTTGTAPAWSSGSDTHTLNIPMASAAGATAGLLSNADYVAFNSKQDAGNYITALSGDVTASGPGSAGATIAANAVTTAKILDGTILGADLNYGGVNTVTSGLVIKDNVGKFFNFTCGTTGNVATWTATGWACQAPTAPLPSCATNEVLKWNGTGWACGTDNAGTGTVTGVTATAPLASSGGTAPVISISNGTTAGQTLRWGGASWVAAQLSNSDITGLGTLATKNSVDLGTADATGTLAAARMPALTGDVTSTAGSTATTLANSGVTAGTYSKVTVDTKGRVTVGATISSSDVTTALTYTPLNKAGDVMTGTIGLGNYTNATEATLIAGFTAADKGKTWFNSTTGQVKYWDGTAAKALGISGAGLTSLGGQTGSTQTFAIGTTGTAPAWSSVSDTHTLNIPMAATAGTTAGLLSKTDYDAFNSKQAAGNYVTALTGDVTAAGPGSAAATIAANAVTTGKILDGTILGADLNYGGVNLATSGLVIKDNTGKFFDFACGSTGNVATWTATGWACQAPTPLLPSLANGKIWIGDGTNAAVEQTMSGDAVITNLGAVTVNNVRVDRVSSAVGQYLSYKPNNVACANNEVLKWNGTGWTCGTDNAGTGTVTGVTATAPLASSGGAAPVISISNGSTTGQTLRWSGAAWVAAQLSTSDVTGLGSLATQNSVDLGTADATGTLAAARMPALTGDVTSTAGSTTTTLANSGVTAGTYSKVTVDAKGRVTTGANIASSDVTTALGYTPVNKSGDVMTGLLGLNSVASDPAGLTAADKGKVWYNTTSNQIKYWDGAVKALGVSGAGLTSLGGQTGSTQSFAIGTTGTAPGWSSSSDIHTLNIPMAATAGTTAGLLSKTDYDAFNSKQAAGNYVTALTGDVTAAGPGSAAATISANSVTTGKILDGTILGADLNYGGVNVATSNLVIKDNTGKFFDFACATTGHVATWTATGWACQAPATYVTGVTATAPLASSGGAAPVISISNGSTTGQTLRWGGASWTAAQLSNSDITGLGTLATKNSVASADITDGTITGVDVSSSAALSVASVTTSGNASVGGTLTVTTSISAPSYNYTSDRRLKKDIVTMSGLDTILKLRGVRFNWIKDGKPEVGLIAQEVEQVEPNLVVTDERTGFKAVKYGNVVSPLIEATKELYGMCVTNEEATRKNTRDVASLKAEVQELRKQNEDLRKEIQEIRNMIMEQKR